MTAPVPQVEMVTITPAVAEDLLLRNTSNRPVRQANVEALTRDMKEGRYQFNGDAIRIDANNVMLDGQHRLMAVVASGTTHNMLVVSGLPPESMMTIDAGVKRTTGDRLALSGRKNGNILAATLSVMNGIAHGVEKRALTSGEAFDLLLLHPAVEESVSVAQNVRHVVGVSYLAAVHYIGIATGHKEKADEFLQVFRTGFAARENDPARTARERLLRSKEQGRRLVRSDQLEILTAAWENKRLGREVSVIRPRGGENRIRMTGWDPLAMGILLG